MFSSGLAELGAKFGRGVLICVISQTRSRRVPLRQKYLALTLHGMQDSKEVRGAVWTLSGTYVVWRMTLGFWRKLQIRMKNNVNRKSQLEYR